MGLVWALLVAVIAQFALGFLWYGPLFGKPWMAAMGWDKRSPEELKASQKAAMPGYATSIGGSIVATVVIWILYHWAEGGATYSGPMLGLAIGLAGWVAFYLPGTLTSRFFESGKWMLTIIGSGYWLAGSLIQGAAVGFFG